jgi:hypothetical protein
MDCLTMILVLRISSSICGRLFLKVMTNLGMFLHGLLDHDSGVEDLLQHLRENAALHGALEEDDAARRDADVIS